MSSTNNLYGIISIIGDETGERAPVIIDPSGSTPYLSFTPPGSSDDGSDSLFLASSRDDDSVILDITRGSTPFISLRDKPVNGSLISVPQYGTGNVESASPYHVLLTDTEGNIGTRRVLPVSLGGTGTASVPPSGSLLMSNGSGYTGISAGPGITINPSTGTISSVPVTSPVLTQIAYSVTSQTSSFTLTGDGATFITEYLATTSGTQTVSTIDITGYDMVKMTVSGMTKRSASIGGVADQQFCIIRGLNIGGYPVKSYNTSTTISPLAILSLARVDVRLEGTRVIIRLDLARDDVWKAIITLVGI